MHGYDNKNSLQIPQYRYHNTDTTIQIPQYKYQTIIDEKTNNDSQNTTDMSSYKLVVAKA
jgi:hypothetical protein